MSQWTESSGSGGGEMVFSDTTPESPSRGLVWIDESFRTPAQKYYDGEKWVTLVEGSNVPGTQTYTNSTTVDVSNIDSTVEVRVAGGKGDTGGDRTSGSGSHNYPGGNGGVIIASIDLAYYDTLEIRRNQGERGEEIYQTLPPYNTMRSDGGDGMEILSGDGTRLVGGGGGGGGSPENNNGEMGEAGAGGGPNGGSGGYGDGEDGGIYLANHPSVASKSTSSNNEGASVELFTDGGGGVNSHIRASQPLKPRSTDFIVPFINHEAPLSQQPNKTMSHNYSPTDTTDAPINEPQSTSSVQEMIEA